MLVLLNALFYGKIGWWSFPQQRKDEFGSKNVFLTLSFLLQEFIFRLICIFLSVARWADNFYQYCYYLLVFLTSDFAHLLVCKSLRVVEFDTNGTCTDLMSVMRSLQAGERSCRHAWILLSTLTFSCLFSSQLSLCTSVWGYNRCLDVWCALLWSSWLGWCL